MATNPTPLNIACLEILALNVLKNSSPEKIASDINMPELDSCSSIKISPKCLKPGCMEEIESVVKIPGSQDIDLMEIDTSKKCTNDPKLFPDKPSNKKVKQIKKESLILKKLIEELSTEPSTPQVLVTKKENANNFVDLYNNITHTETENEIINQEVITSYYLFGKALEDKYDHYKKNNPKRTAQALVNKEVRSQLPNSVSDDLLRKKKERAQKIYELFTEIGVDKIQRVKSITASSISKLSQNEIDAILLPNVYLPNVKTLRRNNVNIAESQYCQELEEAITTCGTNNSKNKRKLVDILSQFNMTSKEQYQKFYKEAWMGEKEKERNFNIIQENIEFILSGCRVKLENSCSEATMVAYTEIVRYLERSDPAMIKPEVLLASGIIDLFRNEDQFVNLLSSRSKQILMHHEFGNNEFLREIKFIVDDFMDTYKDLRSDFDPVLMRPIAFPREEISIESRCILMTVFDLLEGFLRPLLTEDDYSENSYVIHAVSKLDTVENEIVLAEVSQLLPQQDKEIIDWKKLVPRSINIKLGKVPVLGIQVIRDRVIISALNLFEDNFYQNALKMRFVVEKIIAMSVDVKDEISLLPIITSELEVLKQHITELETKNAELRKENTKIHNLRFKLSVSDAEIAELKCRNAKFLRANREYNKKRDAKNDKEAISEVLPEISASNNNTDIKSSKDQKMNTFLDDAHKKSVSNAIRQCNREKKLLCELSTKDLSRDESLLSKPPTSSVTQDKESHLHKKKLEAENIMQDVFDFTMDGSEKKQPEGASHIMEISLTGYKKNNCQEKIESQGDLAELSSSDILQNINRLYENACTAENKRVKVNQAEILCWRNFIIGLDNSIGEIMIKEKNPNTELPNDQEGPVNADDGDPNSINDNSDSYYSEKEMPDESDNDGYSGCGGYNKYGESNKNYYYDL
ncbi:9857_t:CDS:10, partial [Gigaspora margarita]